MREEGRELLDAVVPVDWKLPLGVMFAAGIGVASYAYSTGAKVSLMTSKIDHSAARLDLHQDRIFADHDILIDMLARLKTGETRDERVEAKVDQLLGRR